MASIELSADYPCEVARLWQIIGDPGRTDWVAAVSSCTFDGECRTMEMAGAGRIVEQIYRLDPDAHTIEYGVVESPAPLTTHRASMRLESLAEGTRLHWRTQVEPAQFAEFIEQGMQAGIAGLRDCLATGD